MPDFNDFLLDDTGRTDDTERFHQAQLTAAEHIRHLHKQVTEVGELLKTQQDILRQKGTGYPPPEGYESAARRVRSPQRGTHPA